MQQLAANAVERRRKTLHSQGRHAETAGLARAVVQHAIAFDFFGGLEMRHVRRHRLCRSRRSRERDREQHRTGVSELVEHTLGRDGPPLRDLRRENDDHPSSFHGALGLGELEQRLDEVARALRAGRQAGDHLDEQRGVGGVVDELRIRRADQVQRDVGRPLKLLNEPGRSLADDRIRREPFVDGQADFNRALAGAARSTCRSALPSLTKSVASRLAM